MGQVIWSPQALDDVEAICAYVGREAPHFAHVFGEKLFSSVHRLGQFPKSGRVVPELQRDDYREIIFQSYRIIYRLVPGGVEIVTVHHGARLFGAEDAAA